jgi:predicted O-methyltransferase YrrM
MSDSVDVALLEQSAPPLATNMSIRDLMDEIETVTPEGGTWCSVDKSTTLAALVLAIRPTVVVELGVWMGGSAIPMALALRHLRHGQLIAIDSWSTDASIAGQNETHAKWWGETQGDDGHQRALDTFMDRLQKHDIGSASCWVVRQRTDEAVVPAQIDLLHHDANHGPQAIRDIQRWAPAVRTGGFLVIDDLHWPGGHVVRARDLAVESFGFVELYKIGTGCVLQRVQ